MPKTQKPANTPKPAPCLAIIGMGYVGLPLALAFGKIVKTIGIDQNRDLIRHLQKGDFPHHHSTNQDAAAIRWLTFSDQPPKIGEADFIIITVPTPIDAKQIPDLTLLRAASVSAGRYMKKGAIVIYESTVFPGCTEEICVPILEQASRFRWKRDFFVGYCPERIAPGDQKYSDPAKIDKIIAGDLATTRRKIQKLYAKIIHRPIHAVASIKVAETAKLLENIQRDLNIALMNETAKICHLIGIKTCDVIDAAATKWNFHRYSPGLVGGHCIGVDPYYMTYMVKKRGYQPEMILAGRNVNEGMVAYLQQKIMREIKKKSTIINFFGITFKPNIDDLRNSKFAQLAMGLRQNLQKTSGKIHIYDSLAKTDIARSLYGFELTSWSELPVGDILVIGAGHQNYPESDLDKLQEKLTPKGIIFDFLGSLDPALVKARKIRYWRL